MHAAVWSIAHIASLHCAKLVGQGAFDDKYEFVAHMFVARQLGAWLDTTEDCTTLCRLVSPERFHTNPRLYFLPSHVAHRDNLRTWTFLCSHTIPLLCSSDLSAGLITITLKRSASESKAQIAATAFSIICMYV